ncbi:mediator of RNA polymerase II transcription subunit 16-like [Quercus lobata]|uniref:mediator of RNA polymerase II transcription subunit 16-like n=1 Tax=Quercus lobata TaxID=97700 RepID=UPI0012493E06|nr:mediator of RNA polymerase II transcription subunit 16-like [Quercus lobata]
MCWEYCRSDMIKCRLLGGTNAQEVRAMVLDMQARLLLGMVGRGIAAALINPSSLVPEPWQASDCGLAPLLLSGSACQPKKDALLACKDLAKSFE